MSAETTATPRVLIEDWLPVAELGIESRRERAAASALPPLSFLHVWWARRPLVASAGVVLAGILPAWTPDLAAAFPEAKQVKSERAYRAWLLHLIGIWGDPITARRAYDAAVANGVRIPNPYTYKQAFRNHPDRNDIDLLHAILRWTWGDGGLPLVADPTAGGGSIPFTAARLGIPAFANDLNGVAASVLRAGVGIPAEKGTTLIPHLREWGALLIKRVEQALTAYYPSGPGETVATYLWANAVTCPRTGGVVPLLTDKWLRKEKGKEAAVTVEYVKGRPVFDVVLGRSVDATDASNGTVARGGAVSPYDNLVIDADYIKAEAQAGRMEPILYAVAVRTGSGERSFRAPTASDLRAIEAATSALADRRAQWDAEGILPTEEFPSGNDMRPVNYGMRRWIDFFTPRQALVHGTFGAEFRRLVPEVRAALGDDLGNDVLFELALMQGKALNWNSRLSSWNVNAQSMRSVFDRHDFAFKWTFAEFEGAKALYSWCFSQLIDAFGGIAGLLDGTGAVGSGADDPVARTVAVTQGSGANLALAEGSVTHLCIDPPYYDNVMYAELADFFYVWEKRTLGLIEPSYFRDDLTDKDNEAVANVARFSAMGKRKRELADLDYESKMTAIFAESRRVLRDNGVLSVMFTHKRAEAWDTLGMSLLSAGFSIETSWPVNTEREQSLHQANMNSAASTIMLVCRKRESSDPNRKTFLDDIEAEVREAAREAMTRFRADGIDGVDLLLSTYGPVLSVISRHWPVYSSNAGEDGKARLLRPDEALDLAREEVVRLQRKRIVGREVQVDDITDFVMIAWQTYKAREFPYDEALKLGRAVGGLDVDKDLAWAKVLDKKSGTVRLLTPKERLRRGGDEGLPGVRPAATSFESMIDAVDTVLYIAQVDGLGAAKTFMDRLGLTSDARFLATVQGLLNAIPRGKAKGDWVVPEAGLLDTLAVAYLPDVVTPSDEEVAVEVEQLTLG